MNPLSKLQSEAVKKFERNVILSELYSETKYLVDKLAFKQFLSDQLDKAYSNGREETIKQIRKMETSSYTLDGAYLNENIDFICKKLKKSSIKRKIK